MKELTNRLFQTSVLFVGMPYTPGPFSRLLQEATAGTWIQKYLHGKLGAGL